jgi:hypothetical protein
MKKKNKHKKLRLVHPVEEEIKMPDMLRRRDEKMEWCRLKPILIEYEVLDKLTVHHWEDFISSLCHYRELKREIENMKNLPEVPFQKIQGYEKARRMIANHIVKLLEESLIDPVTFGCPPEIVKKFNDKKE